MGYGTWFTGHLNLEKKLSSHHLAYLQAFSETQHVQWNADLLQDEPDPLREAVGLPLGENGCYFTGRSFKEHYSYPPWQYEGTETDPAYLGAVCPGKPDHYCAWMPDEDGAKLVIASDKPYGYLTWLRYLIEHFFLPWGYSLNGEMTWQGEEEDDTEMISVKNNVIIVHQAPQADE